MTLAIHEAITEWKRDHPQCELCTEPTLTVLAEDYLDEDGERAVRLATFCRNHSATLPATCPRCGRTRRVFRSDGSSGELICDTCREGEVEDPSPTRGDGVVAS